MSHHQDHAAMDHSAMHHHHHEAMYATMSNNSIQSFCTGDMAMIMYMDGFHWGLAGGQPCLNLFVASWTLDSRFKFVCAMLCIFGLAIMVQGSRQLRYKLIPSRDLGMRSSRWTRLWRSHKIRASALHATQALVGYLLMLTTMTFAVEFLLAVVLGLGVGHALFDESHAATAPASNPCCDFLEGPGRESQPLLLSATSSGELGQEEDGAGESQVPLLPCRDSHRHGL